MSSGARSRHLPSRGSRRGRGREGRRARCGWWPRRWSGSTARSTAARVPPAAKRCAAKRRCARPSDAGGPGWRSAAARSSSAGGPAAARVEGDAAALEQAIDNLIVNAIEHGGPEIVVEGWSARGPALSRGARFGHAGRGRTRGAARPGELIDRAHGQEPPRSWARRGPPGRRPIIAGASRCAARPRARRRSSSCRCSPPGDAAGWMKRRSRALAFLALALVSAAAGAAIVAGYGSSVAGGYGPLRQVVVLSDADSSPRSRSGRVRSTRRSSCAASPPASCRRERSPTPPKRSGWSCGRRPRPAPICSPRSWRRRGSAARGPACGGGRQAGRDRGHRRRRAVRDRRAQRGAAGGRRRHQRTERARARAGPTWPPPGCRCSRSAPAQTAPARAGRRPRPSASPGAQALRLISAESFARKLTLLPER